MRLKYLQEFQNLFREFYFYELLGTLADLSFNKKLLLKNKLRHFLSLHHRLVSCSWHGGDSRQYDFQQGRFSNTCLLQPFRRCSCHELHLPSALLFRPEQPAHQSCASQPHAGHGATRNGHGADERGDGGPRNGPGHDAGQPHGNALQQPFPNGTPRLCSFGTGRHAAPSADFGWAHGSGRNDGGGRINGRRRNGGREHQPVSSLRKRCHFFFLLTFLPPLSYPLPPRHSSVPPSQIVSTREKKNSCPHQYLKKSFFSFLTALFHFNVSFLSELDICLPSNIYFVSVFCSVSYFTSCFRFCSVLS